MLWKIAKAGKSPVLDLAASELARCLEQIDPSADTAILSFSDHSETVKAALWLRVCPELVSEGKDPQLDDAYSIQIEQGQGSITGSNERSVLFGVYRFLRELGASWVRPGRDGEILPDLDLSEVRVHVAEAASYRHRGICIEGAVSYHNVVDMIDWMPKLGYNAYFNQFSNPVTFYDRWYRHQGNPLLDPTPMSAQEIAALRDESVRELKKRGLLYHEAGHGWTCEPFGIPGETWDNRTYDIPRATVKYLAKVNGKRGLWNGVPLNTNLCYSNPAVRRRIAQAVAARCKENPSIDYVQVWLADGTNNHCECEACRAKRPADWYLTVLNEIDAELTRARLSTRVVFLLYVDLLWEPLETKLVDPDRFTLMFAPITRTYSASIADAEPFDEEKLPDYVRNQLQFPASVGENLAWMRRWRRGFDGDGFDFDYHFMWDHLLDPGYYSMAETLFKDMQALHSVGLNGMMSCQNQRVFFPNGLGMTAMAAALWDEKADFEAVASAYFLSAYGEDGPKVQAYLQSISEAFDPPYLRGEKTVVDPQAAARFAGIPAILDDFLEEIEVHAGDETLPEGLRASWEYLSFHSEICRLLAKAWQTLAEGSFERAKAILEETFSCARAYEPALKTVFDVFEFQLTHRRNMDKCIAIAKSRG